MNISSIIIKTEPNKIKVVIEKIKEAGLCEIHLHEDNKIIGLIEAESISDEIGIVKKINTIPEVISTEMSFSYCEEELNDIRNNIEMTKDLPDWLNDDSLKAGQIDYQGDLKKKF